MSSLGVILQFCVDQLKMEAKHTKAYMKDIIHCPVHQHMNTI